MFIGAANLKEALTPIAADPATPTRWPRCGCCGAACGTLIWTAFAIQHTLKGRGEMRNLWAAAAAALALAVAGCNGTAATTATTVTTSSWASSPSTTVSDEDVASAADRFVRESFLIPAGGSFSSYQCPPIDAGAPACWVPYVAGFEYRSRVLTVFLQVDRDTVRGRKSAQRGKGHRQLHPPRITAQ